MSKNGFYYKISTIKVFSHTFEVAVRGSNAHNLTQPLSSNPIVITISIRKEDHSSFYYKMYCFY